MLLFALKVVKNDLSIVHAIGVGHSTMWHAQIVYNLICVGNEYSVKYLEINVMELGGI